MPSLPCSIAHLDMDAFFASVELLALSPAARPAVVVAGAAPRPADRGDDFPASGSYSGRGVITTATYEARTLGVHSGMGLMKAAQLAPDAILLPADFDAYRHYSRLFKAAARPRAADGRPRHRRDLPRPHPLNPDGSRDGARPLALELQQAVRRHRAVVLLGVAPQQAARQAVLRPRQARRHHHRRGGGHPARIWPLPARRINGIGPKAAARSRASASPPSADLAAADPAWLQDHFGNPLTGNGCTTPPTATDPARWSPSSEPKACPARPPSSATSTRLDKAELSERFTRLCEQLADDLARKGYLGKTIGLKLRFDNFHTVTRDQTLPPLPATPG